MRRKDNNVRASISKCMMTECVLHKEGSSTAASYSAASKTTTNFLNYLLCPKIHRDELAVKVDNNSASQNSFTSRTNKEMAKNLLAAEARKKEREANFNASCCKKGKHCILILNNISFMKLIV